MTFSIRHFLRQISAEMLQTYFEFKGSTVPSDWGKLNQTKLAKRLAEKIMFGEDVASEPVLADLIRLDPMASERGRNALLNAASHDAAVAAKFRELGNDHERALWMFIAHQDLFRDGEGLRFFDYYSEGSRGRHYKAAPNLPVNRTESDVAAFRADVCKFYRQRDGSGVSCRVEFMDRRAEGTVQATLYVQGLPSHATELVNGDFKRRISHPTIDAAIVYDPREGHTTTVAKGGAPVHAALREAFARKLLKVDPKFDVVATRRFRLETLKSPRPLQTDPSFGIQAVRVRRLTLAPANIRAGLLTIEAPAGEPNTCVYDIGNRWFVEKAHLYEKFKVVRATIAMHFHPAPTAKRAKTINLELSSATSNLKDLTEADRKIAEAHIQLWQLIEPAS
jgi:hypothetical protein